MPRSEGSSIAHKAGSHKFVATLAGVDLDCRLCLVVAAAISLALIGGSQLELLVAALAFLRTVWVRSRTGSPTPRAKGSAEKSKDLPQQEPRAALAQHRCGGDRHSPRADDAAAVAEGERRPKLPRVRGRDLRPSAASPPLRAHCARASACQKYVELIMEHAHAKQWQQALEVLTEMRQLSIEPNVACFTALISACDKGKQPEKALELFDTMLKEGVEPTVVTYNALISACSNGLMPETALEKCAEMKERGLTPNVVTYTSLIRACGQSHHPRRAWEVFDAMKEAGEKPNVITFSSLIQAADKCQDPERGLRIFAEMEEAGIAPSLFAYNNLKSCWRNQPVSRALEAIRVMRDEGRPPSRSACSAVRNVCDQDRPDKAVVPGVAAAAGLKMLTEMLQKGPKPEADSYAAVIGVCEKSRQPEQALQRFQEMLDEGVSPDVLVYNCAIRCCEQLGDVEKAVEVFEKMKERQVSPDVDTYASLISVGGKGCTLAMDYFKEMQDRGLTPTCHEYNIAISACSHLKRRNGKNGVCIGLALDLFRSMKEAKVAPDVSTYNALIAACEKRMWPTRAEELFREMEASGLEPDVVAYNGLMSCWANSSKTEMTMQLLEEMQSKGVAPNITTYSTLVRACGKAGDEAKMREFKEKEAMCARLQDKHIKSSSSLVASSHHRAMA
jgi:pentatricopeptide repeat protein